MAALVSVSLGSNISPELNVRKAVAELKQLFGAITISPVYQTAAVGFDGEDFLNLVVSFSTGLTVYQLVTELKGIEDRIGRDRAQPRFSPRLIDLDLLTYDNLQLNEPGLQLPRAEILQNAFVLKPLSDIQGESLHPELQRSYQQLWQDMKKTADRIEHYEMQFD
ncbi:MAG: 2-amino-4-hydroxy-6-hydroxymethyldihydropteridine diphosphokinase [Gammaproteobacteria bacterium]|nr:2-amino-4-hydroxy-6-hydroxymethyldihydropteridine diphosphokinase [Gammaproteobacteria bacterium]